MRALYASVAEDYWRNGWQPVPLPVREKKQPPAGVTGQKGRDVTEEDVAHWTATAPPLSNIGLRMPENVVGIDVDDYLADDGTRKVGGQTLADLEADLGPLPPTTVSSCRFAAFPESGIRFYIVPDAYDTNDWPEKFGQDVDTIRHGHRYAVVHPSVVKGRTYQWLDQRTGELGAAAPSVAELPELPTAWCEYMQPSVKPSTSSGATGVSASASHPYLRAALNNAHAELAGVKSGDRNNVLNAKAYSLGRLVAGTELTEDEVRRVLTDACKANGYLADEGEHAVEATISSGLEAGAENPKGVPTVEVDEEAILAMAGEAPEPPDEDTVLARFPRTDLGTLLSDDAPEREWLVERFLSKGTSASLVAGAGQGKSLLSLWLSLCVARGQDFLGMHTEKGRVLYVDLENTDVDLAERLEALKVTEADVADLDNFIHLCLPPLDPLDTATGGAVLFAILDAYTVGSEDLLVLDSTQRMVAGDEDSADTWRAFYRHTSVELKRRKITTLRLDNTGKDEKRRARGSSGKRDDVDVEWMFKRSSTGFTLTPTKARYSVEQINGLYDEVAGGYVEYGALAWGTHSDVEDAIDLLDAVGVPDSAGLHAAYEAVKSMKAKPTRKVLRQAQRERQKR